MEAKCNVLVPPIQIYCLEHEGFKYVWNVDQLIQDRDVLKRTVININSIVHDFADVNVEYALKTDTSKPLIVIEYENGTFELLDGNHRLYRMFSEQKDEADVYVLNEKIADKYIMKKYINVNVSM